MTDDKEAAASRAAIAAHEAVKAEPRSTSRSFVPLLLVAFAILSGVYLFMTDTNEPAQPTTPMPVPHVQAPGGSNTGAPPAPPAPQQ